MLVIFDFDGTLADTWPWLAEELVSGADRLGYRRTTRAELEMLRRLDTRAIFERLAIPFDKVAALAADLRQRAEASARFPLFDGIPHLIRTLRTRGATLAVASSNTEPVVRSALGPDLAALIGIYACNVDVFGKAKAYVETVRRAAVPPGDTVAIGDETRDLDAAETAGVRGLVVEWGYADPELLRSRAPGRTAASVDALLRLIGGEGERP